MRLFGRHRPPRQIGAFKIIEKIGEGGMCTIYRAHQASLDRTVAVKVLNEKLGDDPQARDRFERESRIIAHLAHPNIVHVLDRGITPEGAPYFVMQYVEGTDLTGALAAMTLDLTRKLEIAIQVCRAVAYAHKNGVIHRDLKPANIVLDRDGNAVVLDFGIAKIVDRATEHGDDDDPQSVAKRQTDKDRTRILPVAPSTRADLVLGTVAYMAPEQLTGEYPVTPASDLYSLGVVLYEMFTGSRPVGRFRRPSEVDPAIPAELDPVVLQCLESEPSKRFASADQLRDRLLELLHGAHLDTEQRERAGRGLDRIREKCTLLDVIRETPGGGVYLYQNRANRELFVVRKRIGSGGGLAEARLLGALRHERLVEVHGCSGDEQRFIVVMEYLTGGSLRDRLVGPLPLDETLRLGCEVAEGLAFAHRNRIVHGTLRPANLLLTGSGSVKISDFGFDEHTEPGRDPYNPFREPRSAGADIVALGAILHQALTGLIPAFRNGTLVLEPQFLRLPPEVRSLLAEMLSHDRARRMATCEQAGARLQLARAVREAGSRRAGGAA